MEESTTRRFWKRVLLIAIIVLSAAVGLAVLVVLLWAGFLADIFWYNSLGYLFYYFLNILYPSMVVLGVGLFFLLICGFNFWLAARMSARPIESVPAGSPAAPVKLSKRRRGSYLLLLAVLSLAPAVIMAWPAYGQWQKFLFFIAGPSSGLQDPYFGRDVSFFLFRYPVYVLLLNRMRVVLALLLVGTAATYAANGSFFASRRRLFRATGWHLGILASLFALLEIWAGALQLFGLVYDHSHFPTFDGPGYAQMMVTRPLIFGTMFLIAVLTLLAWIFFFSRRGKSALAVAAAALAVVIGLRLTDFPQRTVEEYVVKPNQLSKEAPWIAKNIKATLDAYGLHDIETRDYAYRRFPEQEPAARVSKVLQNIPLWNENTLETVFHQLQVLRPYYSFPKVSVGRYMVEKDYQQVFLAPREIDYPGLPESAQNWVNRHLTYTHGYGAVMVSASQRAAAPINWLIRDIPPESAFGLKTTQPRVYYGLQRYDYVIAPNSSGELDYPLGDSNVTGNYSGTGGVPIDSLFKKLLYAYYFKAKEIFFTTKTTERSRILYRRNIIERVTQLVPYLRLDGTPYVVQTERGIFWFIDAYTSSDFYPGSAPFRTPGANFNYLRNSVKIIVDAFNGSIDFYVYNESDPIIQTYRRIYPGVFKSKESMPADLLRHVRYPKDIFSTQMRIYARYHQTDPAVFYNQEDLWTFADLVRGNEVLTFQPYYLTVNLMQPDRLDFLLLMPMMPKNRNNLRSVAFAASDEPYYSKIVVYNFPKGELIYGPAQINAIINQDPQISQLFTLWDQSGSEVRRGEMIILPMGDAVFFIQPVYLVSRSEVSVPELQRVIMSEGQVAVIAPSLEEAFTLLRERVNAQYGQQQRLLPPGTSEPMPAPGGASEVVPHPGASEATPPPPGSSEMTPSKP